MSDDLKRLSDLAFSGEELLNSLLRARGDAEIDTQKERAKRWGDELVALGKAVDPLRLRFHILRPTLEQTARIWSFYPELRNDQSFFVLVRAGVTGIRSVELIPTLISNMQVNRASGSDYREIVDRIKRLSEAFDTNVTERESKVWVSLQPGKKSIGSSPNSLP